MLISSFPTGTSLSGRFGKLLKRASILVLNSLFFISSSSICLDRFIDFLKSDCECGEYSFLTKDNINDKYQPSNAFDRDYDTYYNVKDNDADGNFLKLTLEKEVIVHEVRVVSGGCCLQRIATTTVMVYNGDNLEGDCESITGK